MLIYCVLILDNNIDVMYKCINIYCVYIKKQIMFICMKHNYNNDIKFENKCKREQFFQNI